MNVTRCPYLGMQDDPDTRLDFPSRGNTCHKASPPGPVRPEYQQNTCLTGQHITCPVYAAAQAIPLPAGISAPTVRASAARRALPASGLPLALALVVVLGLAFLGLSNWLGASGQNGAGNGGQNETRPNMFALPQTGSNEGTATPDPTNVQRRTACPMPEGWMPYTVNPTDSLYRLSVVHSVPVEELQRANCMGDETVILPGQVIYVPFMPTITPSVTPSPTRFIPASTFTSAPDDEEEPAPVNPATEAPPTSVPPTRAATTPVPNTPLPPTNAPTQVPTTAVPPTAIVPTVGIPTIGIPTLPLPTLPPILEPTETPEPGGGNNNNRTETIDCGSGVVTVDGNNNSVEVTGACLGVIVTGNNNHISVPPGTPVDDRGNNNTIEEG